MAPAQGAPSPRPKPSPPPATNLRPAKGRRLGHSPPPRPLGAAAARAFHSLGQGDTRAAAPLPRAALSRPATPWRVRGVRGARRAGGRPGAGAAGRRGAGARRGGAPYPPPAVARWCGPAGEVWARGLNGPTSPAVRGERQGGGEGE